MEFPKKEIWIGVGLSLLKAIFIVLSFPHRMVFNLVKVCFGKKAKKDGFMFFFQRQPFMIKYFINWFPYITLPYCIHDQYYLPFYIIFGMAMGVCALDSIEYQNPDIIS